MLAASAGWVVYSFGSLYGSCRIDGTGKLGCFIMALLVSLVEALDFVAIAKLLMLIRPEKGGLPTTAVPCNRLKYKRNYTLSLRPVRN
jgi:hypothetical protein